MRFTEAGVDYMFRNHREFIKNIRTIDVDFGDWSELINELLELANKYGLDPNDMVTKFQIANSTNK